MKNMPCDTCGCTCWVTDSTLSVCCAACVNKYYTGCEWCNRKDVSNEKGSWEQPFWFCDVCTKMFNEKNLKEEFQYGKYDK